MGAMGPTADKFRSEPRTGGEDEAATVKSNYRLFTPLARPRECIGKLFAKAEFKCPPAATIGGSRFEQGGEREVVEVPSETLGGYTRFG